MSMLILPKEAPALSATLTRMLDESREARISRAIEWYIAFHYLQGARYFEQVSYSTGDVVAFYHDMYGQLPFRYEDILVRYQTEVGRLMRLDVRPAVKREGTGLQHIRKAATAFVVLDTILRSQNLNQLKLDAFQMLVLYGTVGFTNWTVSEPGVHDTIEDGGAPGDWSSVHVFDTVPPWELLPLPARAVSGFQARAVCRERWVPYAWLKDKQSGREESLKVPARDNRDLEVHLAPPASMEPHGAPVQSNVPGPPSVPDAPTEGGKVGQPHDINIPHVRLREIWVPSASRRLGRYIIMGGKCIMFDRDYLENPEGAKNRKQKKAKGRHQDTLPPMPMGVSRYAGGLGFFGRGFVPPLVSLNAEVESMLLSLFRNVQDMDQFGFTFYPESWGIPPDYFQNAKPGRRFTSYQLDPVEPNAKVQTVKPVNAGTLPGKIAEMGIGLMDRQAQQPQELMAGRPPGRMESGKGVDILYQTSTIPLGSPAISIAEMFATAYRSVLWHTAGKWPALRVNLLSLLDDAVVGIQFDPKTGLMSLKGNAVPDPAEVDISIRSTEPTDKDTRKQELLYMRAQQLLSDFEFRIINRKENLGFPTGNDVEWNNYVRAVINSILWFNDGQTPGQGFTTDFDVPAIHEYVVLRRISSAEFSLASKEVQAKFIERLQELRNLRGQMPEQAPYPEDAAEMAVRAAQEAQAAGMGGMPLGPTSTPPGGGLPPDGVPGMEDVPPAAIDQMLGQMAGAGTPQP